jgi:hypothetical protein
MCIYLYTCLCLRVCVCVCACVRACMRQDFLGKRGVRTLKVRFMLMGLATLLLMPFIMAFMVIFFFLRHAEEFHRSLRMRMPLRMRVCIFA